MLENWSDDSLAAAPLWPRHAEYQAACDQAYLDLEPAGRFIPFSSDVPSVVCVARNEATRLGAFIGHYVALGARAIHVIDNGSSDDTAGIAAGFPEVTLWQTTASYSGAAYGQMWVGGLVRRHGLGRWVVNVDADEFLVYSGMETHGLAELQALLSRQSRTRMLTPLVDLYAGPGASEARDAPLLDQTPYFDGRPPGAQPPSASDEVRLDPAIPRGPRARLMSVIGANDDDPCLQKFAVARWDVATAYANVHYPFPLDRNPDVPQGALLHFKFMSDFRSKVDEALASGEHWRNSLEYRRYHEWLCSPDWAPLYEPSVSRRYYGPQSLVDAQLLVPLDW